MSDFDKPTAAETPGSPEGNPSYRSGLVSSASAPPQRQVSSAWQESTDQAASDQAAHQSADPVDAAVPARRVELSAIEARVLGSLIEKSFLTPDVYPMTTNAMVGACNQKTNRDPVVAYTAVEVDAVLLAMRQRELVRRVHSQGARATKHRQTLDEALSLNQQQLALLSVLLLRGPQTIGELRLRTERHDVGFDDLDSVESCLVALAGRTAPLVVQLERQPGHKEARWQHLLHDAEQAAATEQPAATPVEASAPEAAAAPASPPAWSARDSSDVSELQNRIDSLEAEVTTLRRQLTTLAAQLGETLE